MRLVAPQLDYVPHEPGIFPAVCVDFIDLGIEQTSYNGEPRMVPRVRLVFETESPSGARALIGRTFTASLYPTAKLTEFLAKWRGRPFAPKEGIELESVVGVSCTLVISHVPRRDGQGVYAGIDAVSRPTKKVVPSGIYNAQEERQRIAERKAEKQVQPQPLPTSMVPRASIPVGMAVTPAPAEPEMAEDDIPF